MSEKTRVPFFWLAGGRRDNQILGGGHSEGYRGEAVAVKMEPADPGMRNPGIRGLHPMSLGLKTNTVEYVGSYWAAATSSSLALLREGWGRGGSRQAPGPCRGAEAGRPPRCRAATEARTPEGILTSGFPVIRRYRLTASASRAGVAGQGSVERHEGRIGRSPQSRRALTDLRRA